jgi:hypothetical protein
MTVSDREEVKSKKKGLAKEVKQWYWALLPDLSSATDYLNEDPIAGPGEAILSVRSDGSVVVWIYL